MEPAHLSLHSRSMIHTSKTTTEMAGSLTCNDSFHSILKVGSINGFVTLSSSMKSSFITYICYISSCRQEVTRITLDLLCDRFQRTEEARTNLKKDLRKSNSLHFIVSWEQRTNLIRGVYVGFEQYNCLGNECCVATQRTEFSNQLTG